MPSFWTTREELPSTAALVTAAAAAGLALRRLARPDEAPAAPSAGDAFYGDIDFGEALIARGWPLASPALDWPALLPWALRKRAIEALSFAEARRLPGPVFIKAAEPRHKRVIDAGVYPRPADLRRRGGSDASPMLASEPVDFRLELRCFVRESAVIAVAAYQQSSRLFRYGEGRWPLAPEVLEAGLAFARGALKSAPLCPQAFVLDIGLTTDRGWVVVEANAAWSAELYGCEAAAVLTCLQAALRPPEQA